MRALLACLLAVPLLAQVPGLDKLPDWASAEIRESLAEKPPEAAKVWVILRKARFAYTGSGVIRQQTFTVARVLDERGIESASRYTLFGLGDGTSRISSLKGWNLRPDGEMEKLAESGVATRGLIPAGTAVSTDQATQAKLDRVVKGSIVAFESQEVVHLPLGPADVVGVLGEHPIRRWILELANAGGWFSHLENVRLRLEPRNLAPWARTSTVEPARVELRDLPALPVGESLTPWPEASEPRLYVAFSDPDLPGALDPADWNRISAWEFEKFTEKVQRIGPVPLDPREPRAGLESLAAFVRRELSYKAVYMTPERGWIPERTSEVLRRRYGDCKDLAAFYAGGAEALGLQSVPVLARIGGGLPEDIPASPYVFDHVILAVALPRSLGLPAEVTTPAGRYLLVDPTSRSTPLGLLPEVHRGRRVMICSGATAFWIAVPDAAIHGEAMSVVLEGSVREGGDLAGTLTVKEDADALGLRTLALLADAKLLRERLASRLGLGPEASLEVRSVSDPLDPSGPLELKARLALPHALKARYGAFNLEPVALPPLPPVVQQAGEPRLHPVASRDRCPWTWTVDLAMPDGVVPGFPARTLATPFRKASWTASLENGHWRGRLTYAALPVAFGSDQREEGVRAAKKDRSQFRSFQEEILEFRRSTP